MTKKISTISRLEPPLTANLKLKPDEDGVTIRWLRAEADRNKRSVIAQIRFTLEQVAKNPQRDLLP